MEEKEGFVFDLNAMMNFVFEPNISSRSINSEIIETYEQNDTTLEMEMTNKVMREVKDDDFSNENTIRYDLLKLFITTLLTVDGDENNLSLGESVIINTLVNEKIIKKITIED